MELAKRFRGMLADLSLKPADAAKMLHVSLRTVHNWISGKHQIPVMAYKLLRLLRYRELPGKSWAGWCFSRGELITPEGRSISGQDSAWWSLLVRRSHGFTQLYERQTAYEAAKGATADPSRPSAARLEGATAAGLVSFKTSPELTSTPQYQDGAIMGPWPTISDFPPLSMPMPENAAHASESALTPCFASLWMPTFETPAVQPDSQGKHPQILNKSQSAEQTSTPAMPGLRLTPLPGRLQLVHLGSPQSSAKPNAGNSPTGSAKPANPDGLEPSKEAA